ncbi:MAG: antibiotic biosynthesis monooxygenase [Planctomycetes bacterium]|nr:antibiotic biosynthesis monooxygenase [Planctomycetota bacterium]MCC7169009.1 antibiotic biosynthesis monooxygenase [Planctomycetota bacterium]
MPHLTVVATFTAKRGKEAEAKAALTALVAPTRAERGCVNYDLHQSAEDPRQFLFHENWTGKAELDRHLETPHIAALKARVAELFDVGPVISLWTRLG